MPNRREVEFAHYSRLVHRKQSGDNNDVAALLHQFSLCTRDIAYEGNSYFACRDRFWEELLFIPVCNLKITREHEETEEGQRMLKYMKLRMSGNNSCPKENAEPSNCHVA